MAMANLWRSFGKKCHTGFCLLELNFSWPKFAKMQKHVDRCMSRRIVWFCSPEVWKFRAWQWRTPTIEECGASTEIISTNKKQKSVISNKWRFHSVTESKSTLGTEYSTITQAHKNILLHQVRKITGDEVTISGQHFSVAKNATPKKRETITTSRHIGNQWLCTCVVHLYDAIEMTNGWMGNAKEGRKEWDRKYFSQVTEH